MVAFKPGSKLRFAINTTRIDHPDAPTMDVQIAYLRSDEHMGKAVARCAAGCSCNETFIEASHKSQTSTIFLHRMSPSQADECVLEIEVVKDERPEFKFKVTGVMVGCCGRVCGGRVQGVGSKLCVLGGDAAVCMRSGCSSWLKWSWACMSPSQANKCVIRD